MGSGQSSRKLTISNEQEIGVIKVSNAVVQRLAQGTEEQSSDVPVEDVKSEASTPSASSKVSPLSGEPPSGYPVFYYPELTLTALEIQQQKEKELFNQQQYWQKRLHNMETNYKKVNQVMEEEYVKAVKELAPNPSGGSQGSYQPCLKNSDKILKCYHENPKEILKCASLVEEFASCVDQQRTRLIAAR